MEFRERRRLHEHARLPVPVSAPPLARDHARRVVVGPAVRVMLEDVDLSAAGNMPLFGLTLGRSVPHRLSDHAMCRRECDNMHAQAFKQERDRLQQRNL